MARVIGLCLVLLAPMVWAQPPMVEWTSAFLGGAKCLAEMAEMRYMVGGEFTGEEWGGAVGSYDTSGLGLTWRYFAGATNGFSGVTRMPDGNFIWSGNHGAHVVKTDTAGNRFWERDYPGLGRVMDDPCPTADLGYLLVACSDAEPPVQARLMKVNSLGISEETFDYGGPGGNCLGGLRIVRAAPDGYLLIGETWAAGDNPRHGLALRVGVSCDSLWTREWGSEAHQLFYAGQSLLDGGFLLAGMQVNAAGDSLAWLVRLNADGSTLWSHTLAEGKAIGALKPTWDGHYVAAGIGSAHNALWVVKVNAAGDVLWSQTAPGALAEPSCMRVLPTADRGYLVTAAAWPVSLVKFTPDTAGLSPVTPSLTLPVAYRLLDNYPNPFNAQTVIRYAVGVPGAVTLAVFDLTGRVVATLAAGPHAAGSFSARWDAAAFPSGVYFCRLETAGGAPDTRKMVTLEISTWLRICRPGPGRRRTMSASIRSSFMDEQQVDEVRAALESLLADPPPELVRLVRRHCDQPALDREQIRNRLTSLTVSDTAHVRRQRPEVLETYREIERYCRGLAPDAVDTRLRRRR